MKQLCAVIVNVSNAVLEHCEGVYCTPKDFETTQMSQETEIKNFKLPGMSSFVIICN